MRRSNPLACSLLAIFVLVSASCAPASHALTLKNDRAYLETIRAQYVLEVAKPKEEQREAIVELLQEQMETTALMIERGVIASEKAAREGINHYWQVALQVGVAFGAAWATR